MSIKAPAKAKRGAASSLMPRYLPHLVTNLINVLNLSLMQHLRPSDLNPQQFRVMQVLSQRGKLTVGQIARDMVIHQSVVSRVIDQLEERGFVKRLRNAKNGRIVEVSLRPEGTKLINAIGPEARRIIAEALSVLSEKEHETLLDFLERVYAQACSSATRPLLPTGN